jgi:hypothetical protein
VLLATPPIRDLARRLIAADATRENVAEGASEFVRVCDTLRVPLVKLAGVAGFRSLMSRALAIAKVEAPSLDGILVRPDGSLESIGKDLPNLDEKSGVVLVAHLLGLLVTFIGEPLTMRLVCDAWPGATPTGTDDRIGGGL